MSIVYIPDHNESIYAIGERIDEAPEVLIEKKYRSRYSAAIRNEKKQLKSFGERATMGPAAVTLPDPEHFLRKRNGRQSVPSQNLPNIVNRRFSCSLSAKRPDVPLKNIVHPEQNEKLTHLPKNFISVNIDAVTNKVPKRPPRRVVIDTSGTRVPMSDGLEPKYIYGKRFGSTPKYIKEQRHQKYRNSGLKNGSIQENAKSVDRDKILTGLKQNWTELQQEFQKLPLVIDTVPKILRKQKLENLLGQLEKDIVLLEQHPHVYVYNDTKRNECDKNNGLNVQLI